MKSKIQELFEYRKLPYLLSQVNKKERKKLSKNLIELQKRIYQLDQYLESNWDLKAKKLDKYWVKIYKSLAKLGFDSQQSDDLTKHIRKYQLHESQLRDAKMPTRLSKEYYYYYKSCDVRLMRSIILEYTNDNNKIFEISDWRYFDLITEINDDVEDIFEDQDTINGNLFNILIHEDGIESSKDQLYQVLTEFYESSNERYRMTVNKDKLLISKWTAEYYFDTVELLFKNAKKISKKPLSDNSGLYYHLTYN
jgi:predicted DNA-binding ArsR family transcriptional regulator